MENGTRSYAAAAVGGMGTESVTGAGGSSSSVCFDELGSGDAASAEVEGADAPPLDDLFLFLLGLSEAGRGGWATVDMITRV